MNSTFIQRVLLAMIAGFAFACLIEFYKNFILGADRAVNGGFKTQYGVSK